MRGWGTWSEAEWYGDGSPKICKCGATADGTIDRLIREINGVRVRCKHCTPPEHIPLIMFPYGSRRFTYPEVAARYIRRFGGEIFTVEIEDIREDYLRSPNGETIAFVSKVNRRSKQLDLI